MRRKVTMSDQEKLLQANLEALTSSEYSGVYWQIMAYCQGAIRLVCSTKTGFRFL